MAGGARAGRARARARGDPGRSLVVVRLTAAQALVRFLAAQHVERDGVEHRFFGGCFGIFGHGNVAGIGEALYESPELLTYYQARSEQGMVHAAAGYARMRNRLGALACTSSIGPGATNMVTGAALATVNRLPVLLLPGDVFASRRPDPVLQQLEDAVGRRRLGQRLLPARSRATSTGSGGPSRSMPAALQAMRVLVNQAETGAVTLAFPQDVQAEAYDYPDGLPREARLAHPAAAAGRGVARACGRADPRREAAADRRRRRRHLLRGDRRAAAPLRADRDPGRRDAGRQGLAALRPSLGARRDRRDGDVRREPDRRRGRPRDRRSAPAGATSRPPRRRPSAIPDVRFVNVNIADFDAAKHAGVALVGDARATLERLARAARRLDGRRRLPRARPRA